MGAAPSAGGLRDLVTSGVGFWVRGRSLSFYLGLLKTQSHFSTPNQMVHKVAQSPRAKPKMHVKTDLNNPLRAPCNRVYWLKKLTGLGSESHWRKTASSFRREATRPMPAAALFYNPPTLALPSSGRTTSRSSWGSRSVASFSPDDSWSQILGSV